MKETKENEMRDVDKYYLNLIQEAIRTNSDIRILKCKRGYRFALVKK